MNLSTVSWRQVAAAIAATLVGLLAIVVVARADGLPAVDAASARATGWFVHQPTGRVVLVDGYRGLALGSIDADAEGEQIGVAEGTLGAYLLNDTTAEARAIDTASMQLRPPFGLTSLGDGEALASVGQAGLVVVNARNGDATVVPVDGEPVPFTVDGGSVTRIGRDGAVWSLVDGDLVRRTSLSTGSTALGVDDALLTTIGSEPFVVDVAQRRARFGDGRWHDLPTDAAPSEIIVQEPAPAAKCGWVAAGDELWCVGADGIAERSTIDGLGVQGADLLAISGDAGALVRRGPSSIVRIDWRSGRTLGEPATVPTDAALKVTTTVDLIWIDDLGGRHVWAVNPWSVAAIDKNPAGLLVLGDDGAVAEDGESSESPTGGLEDRQPTEQEIREPDDNGVDDPPVAVDDPVTARSGASVPVEVTANDYDPDGEAIAVDRVGAPGHGRVDIATASTVVYTPEPGYVGVDTFDYTIVDGNGTEATASVIVELLAPDTINQPPRGVNDAAETGAGVPIVVDVLLNDIDPERDSLRIGGFSTPPEALGGSRIGVVTEAEGDSGLPALRFVPGAGFEGTANFTYRPIDSFGAVGEDVEVSVEVASDDAPNRAPTTRPDAIRVRRNVATELSVLANDVDPDGDALTVSVLGVPIGLDVAVEGVKLAVTARAGAGAFEPFEYEIDDQHGHTARGWVLVSVIDDDELNRPPLVTPDTAKVVAGESVVVDVIANDVDPDHDPLTVVSVSAADDDDGQAVVFGRRQIQFTPSDLDLEGQTTARLTYTVTDGQGHDVLGDVSITVLPEALEEPPFARDDSTFTFVDVPVTIDVLRNDVDPSGGTLSLVGRPSCLSGGSATITTDSKIRFDPPAKSSGGAYRCTYEVANTRGATTHASIIVSVRVPTDANQAPTAVNDFVTVEIGESSPPIDVTANDRDPDGDNAALRVVSSTAPTSGRAQRNGNEITYTAGPEPDNPTITYQVADADGRVSTGYLIIRVIPHQNEAPIATPDAHTVFAPAGPTQFSVLANDSDPDETPGGLSIRGASMTSGGGSVTTEGSLVTLTPPPDFIGQMTASYTVVDGGGLTATSTVTLTVQVPPNRPPDARDDFAEVANGGTVVASVLLNDIDLDGDRMAVSIVAGPDDALGTASVGSNGSITFSGRPGAAGTAVIRYEVSDGEFSDTAVLTIAVQPCSTSAPAAGTNFLRTGYQIPIRVDLAALAANGEVVDVSGPPGYDVATGIYTPPAGENGNVVVSYSVVNACRQRANGAVTIDVNQAPAAQSVSLEVLRGTSREVPVSLLATDSESLTITSLTGGAGFTTASASSLVVAPGWTTDPGTYAMTATVTDPGGLTATVPISIVVTHPGPTASPDTIDVSDGAPAVVDVVANDNGIGGVLLSVVSVSTDQLSFPNGGTGSVELVPDGRRIRVDPGTGQGTVTFEYTVRNLFGGQATARVTVIGPALPPPTTVPPTTAPPTTVPPTTTAPTVPPSVP